MFVKTVALLQQAFRVDARQLRNHALRGAVALCVLWLLEMVFENSAWLGAPGLVFFMSVAWIGLVMLSLAGGFYFPSVITEEKEQQTLGLLRMAGVGPLTLLTGKSIARLSVVLLLIVLTLPYWWLAVTLGGVTVGQVAASAVILAAHLALVSQIGTMCSVIFATTGPAALAAAVVIAALMFGPYVLAEFMYLLPVGAIAWAQDFVWSLQLCFAPGQLNEVMNSGYLGGVWTKQATLNFSAAIVLFLVSWAVFDRFNTYDTRLPGWWARRRRGAILSWLHKAVVGRFRSGRRRAIGQPIIWKDFQQFTGGRIGTRIQVALLSLWTVGLFLIAVIDSRVGFGGSRVGIFGEVGSATMVFAAMLAGIFSAFLAAQIFERELRQQTWDSLRMLPISLGALCGYKIIGCLKALGPALMFFVIGLLLDFREWGSAIHDFLREPLNYLFCGFFCVATTIFAVTLICFLSLKTNPWLGPVLASGAWGIVTVSGFFCCVGVLDFNQDRYVFVVFAVQALLDLLLTLILRRQIVRILCGENAAG